ncbi:hypothetical protein E2C01_087822 [Portunus trituberculatus]|uniref:Uncharacterized protein n=1 Tax=Portunus trituberculatus TaxID=210409 RepID=A0A5B7JF39_PORTR|nr:hypothetical protein [Portunus trituberculatus]
MSTARYVARSYEIFNLLDKGRDRPRVPGVRGERGITAPSPLSWKLRGNPAPRSSLPRLTSPRLASPSLPFVVPPYNIPACMYVRTCGYLWLSVRVRVRACACVCVPWTESRRCEDNLASR